MRLCTVGVLGALALATVAAPAGHAIDRSERIVGGSHSTETQGAVSLEAVDVHGEHGTAGGLVPWCSASLLDEDSVLTARHCVERDAFRVDRARIGSLERTSGGTTRGIASVATHPDADLAVLTLDAPVSGAETVTLATVKPSAGDTNTLLGWGRTCLGCQEHSPVLKQTDVPVIETDAWYHDDLYGGDAIVTGAGDGHATFGDSGGPQLDQAGKQVGVCSHGDGTSGTWQTYTAVATYLPWITSNAGMS